MTSFVILPHQLYEIKYLNVKYNYFIYEHPHYFKTYKYNQKKIILHRGSMKYYYDYLKNNGFTVKYIEFNERFDLTEYILFDPIDKLKLKGKYSTINSPNFLLTNELCEIYRNKTKNYFFNAFYMWNKKQLNIIPNIKSLDKENRETLPKNIKITNVPLTCMLLYININYYMLLNIILTYIFHSYQY
jgi:deoxyribodipyrimidine photolyase-related protein